MNILYDKLEPNTFGEYLDALIITNIRMWHKQEIVYEVETLEKLSKNEMFDFLKDATWLNLKRNEMMEGLELAFSSLLPMPSIQNHWYKIDEEIIWENYGF